MKFSAVITIDKSDVHAKGQGQRLKVKATEVKTRLSRFQTVTPVWIHIWWWNDARSLMWHRRGALLFLAVIKQLYEWFSPSVCYPVELVLNVENQDDNHATFLDIEVDVEGDQFKTKTYDKRENYKFDIVNYPDLSGNIPHGAAYGVYTSQVIRYTRVCNEADDFKERIKLLTNKLIKKGIHIQLPEKYYEEMAWEA